MEKHIEDGRVAVLITNGSEAATKLAKTLYPDAGVGEGVSLSLVWGETRHEVLYSGVRRAGVGPTLQHKRLGGRMSTIQRLCYALESYVYQLAAGETPEDAIEEMLSDSSAVSALPPGATLQERLAMFCSARGYPLGLVPMFMKELS